MPVKAQKIFEYKLHYENQFAFRRAVHERLGPFYMLRSRPPSLLSSDLWGVLSCIILMLVHSSFFFCREN